MKRALSKFRNMESLRVLKLKYRQTWSPNRLRVVENATPPSVFRVGDFDASLESGVWVFAASADFYSEESARAALEPFLRDWETEWDLMYNLRFSFEFEDCTFESPPRIEGEPIAVSEKFIVRPSMTGSITVALGQYPACPSLNLRSSPLAAQLRARWHEIEVGRNSLLAGGYWFLTTFETEFGGRTAAAKSLRVAPDILSKLGELTARNDPVQGRKNKGPVTPLSGDENAWVKAALRVLMTRAVEVQSLCSGTRSYHDEGFAEALVTWHHWPAV